MRPPLELVPTSVGCSSCQAQLALGRRPLPGQRLAGVVAPPFPSLRQAPRCRALPKQADKTAVAPKAAGGSPKDLQLPEDKWGFLDRSRYEEPFPVTWDAKTTALGMGAWIASFSALGLAVVPQAGALLGMKPFGEMNSMDKAFYALGNQGVETIVGILLINWIVRGHVTGKGSELLNLSLDAPFQKPRGWLAWALFGLSLAPFAVLTAALLSSATHWDDVGGRGTVDAVAGIVQLDLPTYASLFTVTAILAPALEEYVFRGFLLASLTRFMPTWAAVIASSAAFGLCHLSPRDLPQLTSLGIVLGLTYIRSRNLLTPMLIHGAWNGTVLTLLFALVDSGEDLSSLLSQR